MRNLIYISSSRASLPAPDVLIVDDDPDMRAMFRLICQEAGYAVHIAADGLEALAYLRGAAQAQVVVLDYRMPRLDGWGVLSAVAADPALAGAGHVFILVTADAATLPTAFRDLLRTMSVPVTAKPVDACRLDILIADAASRIATGKQQ